MWCSIFFRNYFHILYHFQMTVYLFDYIIILQDNTYKSQKSVWINKKSIANAMLFSLCRWRDFLLSYRTVHRTVLPNFYGFALKFGTTSSSLSLYLKNKSTEKRCFCFLAGAEGLEPSARGFGDRCSTNWAIPLDLVGHQGLEPRTDRLWAGSSDQLS